MHKSKAMLLLTALLAANLLVWVPNSLARRPSTIEQLETLVDVRHELVSNYVEEPDQSKLMESAIRGMIDALQDPHTAYLTQEDLNSFSKQISGTFSGIGAEVDIHQNQVRIVSPLEDSPAWKAGVLAGDIIQEIDGTPTLGMKITEAVERLTGPEGTQVTIKVRHINGEQATITITRARINIQTVKGVRRDAEHHWDFMLDPANKIGYVRLSQFSERTVGELREALVKLQQQDVRGLILDVRFNPGGLLEAAEAVTDMFVDGGKTIVSVRGRSVPEQVYRSTAASSDVTVPMVVLANEASASAAEIVTGALLDNDRAQFVGTRTFGKGSVQQIKMLDSGQGALKLTNAYYYLPGGRNIHRRAENDVWGVDPRDGFYVPMNTEQIREMIRVRREGDVLRKENGNGPGGEVTPEWVQEHLADPQLAAGLKTLLAKIQTDQWLAVGQSNAQDLAMQAKKDALYRQKELIEERLAELDEELRKLGEPLAGTELEPKESAPEAGAIQAQPPVPAPAEQ